MMPRRRMAARAMRLCAVLGVLCAAGHPLAAQSVTILYDPVLGDSISPAPAIRVLADQVPPDLQPASITFVASFDPQFRTPFFVRSTAGVVANYQLDSLLPQHATVYFRAQVLSNGGLVVAQHADTTRIRSWLRLESPPPRATDVLFSNQPTFVWSSPRITQPPGPWEYSFEIRNVAQGTTPFSRTGVTDTTFTPETPLDACTSYRFTVRARATNGPPSDTVVVSPGTFVIQSPLCPQITISYQNFPNPFGRGTLNSSTCFWFDLAHRSSVRLTIYSLTLHPVKTLVPGLLQAVLDSGAYGRAGSDSGGSGCDPRLSWDGTDDHGRRVPPGVYIEVFEADGRHETRKILYKGP